jgi:hypothetical protein
MVYKQMDFMMVVKFLASVMPCSFINPKEKWVLFRLIDAADSTGLSPDNQVELRVN